MDKPTLTASISGLLDTRNASTKEGERFPNIDRLYGPYASKQEAWTALSTPNASGVTALVIGKTVGVMEDGDMVEYWFESACASINDLVKKGADANIDTEEDDLLLENGTLRLADRSSNNGMGYVILRTDKTFAQQVTEDNTIYEIRYEFNLSNTTITLPENAELHFVGGSIKNGTLTGNLTSIVAPPVKIFDNITIGGTWNVSMAFAEWFGAPARGAADYDPDSDTLIIDSETSEVIGYSDTNEYDTPYIQKCLNAFNKVNLINKYLITTVEVAQYGIVENKNTIYIKKGGKGIWLKDSRTTFRGGFINLYPDAVAITVGTDDNSSKRRIVLENTRIKLLDGFTNTINNYGVRLLGNNTGYNTFCEIRSVNMFNIAHGFSGNIRASLIDITVEQCGENVRIDGDLNNIRIVGQAGSVMFDYNHFIYLYGGNNVLIATIYDIGSVKTVGGVQVANQAYALLTNSTTNKVTGIAGYRGVCEKEGQWNRYRDLNFDCFHIVPKYTYSLEYCTRAPFKWRIIGDSSETLDSKYTELVDTGGEDVEMDALHALFDGYYDSTDSQYEGTIADLNADTNIKIQDMRFKAIRFGSITDLDGTEPITTGKWIAYIPVITGPLDINLFQPNHDNSGYISLIPTTHTEVVSGVEKEVYDEGILTIEIGLVRDFIEFASYCFSAKYAFSKIELYSGDTLLETSLRGAGFRNNISIQGETSVDGYFEHISGFKIKLYFSSPVRLKKLALYALTVPKPAQHGSIEDIPTLPNVTREQQFLLEDCKKGPYRNALLTYLNNKWYLPNGNEWTGVIDDISQASFRKTINAAGEYKTMTFETNAVLSPKSSSILFFISTADTNTYNWGIFRISALGVGGGGIRAIDVTQMDGNIAGPIKVYYKHTGEVVQMVITCTTTRTSGMISYNLISSVSNNFANIKDTPADYDISDYSSKTCCRYSAPMSYYSGLNSDITSNITAGTKVYVTDDKRMLLWNGTDWVNLDGTTLQKSGTTSNRPSSPVVGQTFFDTSLSPKKMIVWNGTDWVNLDGSALS